MKELEKQAAEFCKNYSGQAKNYINGSSDNFLHWMMADFAKEVANSKLKQAADNAEVEHKLLVIRGSLSSKAIVDKKTILSLLIK